MNGRAGVLLRAAALHVRRYRFLAFGDWGDSAFVEEARRWGAGGGQCGWEGKGFPFTVLCFVLDASYGVTMDVALIKVYLLGATWLCPQPYTCSCGTA